MAEILSLRAEVLAAARAVGKKMSVMDADLKVFAARPDLYRACVAQNTRTGAPVGGD